MSSEELKSIQDSLHLLGMHIPLSENRVDRMYTIKNMLGEVAMDIDVVLSEDEYSIPAKRAAFLDKLKEASNLACECILMEQHHENLARATTTTTAREEKVKE